MIFFFVFGCLSINIGMLSDKFGILTNLNSLFFPLITIIFIISFYIAYKYWAKVAIFCYTIFCVLFE